MCVLPPFRSSLRKSIIAREPIPLQVDFGQTEYVYVVGRDLLACCTVFCMRSVLGEAIYIDCGYSKTLFFVLNLTIVPPVFFRIPPTCR